jgi:hypothetical protein
VFADDVGVERWRERLVRLKQASKPSDCPIRFNDAYTRYKRDTVRVPARFITPNSATARSTTAIDTIVSEHFGGRSVASADHLERFFFGRGLGKYRWERWENLGSTRRTNAGELAREFKESSRCMSVAYSEPPGPRWVMVDCRTWTNFVRLTEPWRAQDLHWPGGAFDALRDTGGHNRQ